MNRDTETDWNYNMDSCPVDTKVHLLSSDGCPLLPQREYIGTVTYNGKSIVNGECFRGEPEFFYRSAIVAWKGIKKDLMERKGNMDRLTIEYCGEYVPKGLCSIDRLGGADDCDLCCEYCKAKENCRECAINKCFNKLGEYEDLEEQGKLVKLPCAVGDEVYRINRGAEVPIIPMKVIAIGILSLKTGDLIVQITCRDGRDGGTTHYLSWEFGESVFFSEEEAEAALKGGKNEQKC